jgi:hypothetical protein
VFLEWTRIAFLLTFSVYYDKLHENKLKIIKIKRVSQVGKWSQIEKLILLIRDSDYPSGKRGLFRKVRPASSLPFSSTPEVVQILLGSFSAISTRTNK